MTRDEHMENLSDLLGEMLQAREYNREDAKFETNPEEKARYLRNVKYYDRHVAVLEWAIGELKKSPLKEAA